MIINGVNVLFEKLRNEPLGEPETIPLEFYINLGAAVLFDIDDNFPFIIGHIAEV